ncbi:MAG: hypothetical protein A2079_04700 [Geobacteraceae bacterium GWC2_48_7]|nr:MAG: hypothetical protein A2079_04700 [Geobacteraceae bacterium GWC2_48_7]
MSFAGDLEHLPLVDVIQLLHSTRKTGTLCLKSHKGESSLVFNDGYIVGCNHINNTIRIGQILVQMKFLTQEALDKALDEQGRAGINRKPLIATLIENGHVKKEDAYAGLEHLIEMSIVEVMTWTRGTFLLDVDSYVVSDEYRYFPEALNQDNIWNTQSVLMDALRIYDERMRDGTLTEPLFADETSDAMFAADLEKNQLTVDDLGLGDLDLLEKTIPDVFLGLKDYDNAEIHRQKIRETLKQQPTEEQERFLDFLLNFSEAPAKAAKSNLSTPALGIIVYSYDDLIKHLIMTVCKHEDLFVFITDDEDNLNLIIDQVLSRELVPCLVVDAPDNSSAGFSKEKLLELMKKKRELRPEISILQLTFPDDYEFALSALQTGVRSIFPRPLVSAGSPGQIDLLISFTSSFQSYIRTSFSDTDDQFLRQFKNSVSKLAGRMDPSEISLVVLHYISTMFERAITFVAGAAEMTAEKGIGVGREKAAGPTATLKFKVPLVQPSAFKSVIDGGRLFYGQSNDINLKQHLFSVIEAPYSSKILLAPIKSFGKVVAVVYADFGSKSGTLVSTELIEILVKYAGLTLENSLLQKKMTQSG